MVTILLRVPYSDPSVNNINIEVHSLVKRTEILTAATAKPSRAARLLLPDISRPWVAHCRRIKPYVPAIVPLPRPQAKTSRLTLTAMESTLVGTPQLIETMNGAARPTNNQ
jgi:hypothetical protein